MTTTDPVIRHFLLEKVKDDGTAGAALLRYAPEILEAEKRKEKLRDSNKAKQHKRDVNGEHYCMIADEICRKNRSLLGNNYGLARATHQKLRKKQGENAPSTKTIWRALERRRKINMDGL
jgi:hypothetical protein